MFPLIETIIGFAAIMLVLGFLVKSLTSLIKNHFDFYSRHLKHEVKKLLTGTLDNAWEKLQKKSWGKDINWKRVGDEYLTQKNIEWVLNKLGAKSEDLKNLEGRLAVHLGNIKYTFGRSLKNLSIVVGLALCLGLNINAFSIWHTLYNDQQIRATFAGPYADAALDYAEKAAAISEDVTNKPEEHVVQKGEKIAGKPEKKQPVTSNPEEEKERLKQQTEKFLTQLKEFQTDVNFGVGRIWRDPPEKWWPDFVFEFIGSLLTGILVSIGAPYWHDLLRALTKLRRPRKNSTPEE